MKKDILTVRDSIVKIVSMLTLQKIKVTMRGTRAYVSYKPGTGEVVGMNIPYIPDDASEDFVCAIQGFLDHEVGHVLHSAPGSAEAAARLGKRVANVANHIEDAFVERRMIETFSGSGSNLNSLRKFFMEKIIRPKVVAALAAGNLEEARGYALAAGMRAWSGQVVAQDFVADPMIAELIEPVKKKLGPDLTAKLATCSSSAECLELAVQIVKRLAAPEEPKPEPEPEPEEKEEKKKPKKPSEPKEIAPEEKPEEKAKSEKPKEAERSDDKDEAEVEPDDDTEADEGKDKKPEPTGEPGEDDSESEPGDEGEPGGEEEGEDEGAVGTESDDSDMGGSGATDADSDEEDESGESAGREAGSSAGVDDASESCEDPLGECADTEVDFDKAVSERLSATAKAEATESAYTIFSSEFDKIEPAPLSMSSDAVKRVEDSIRDKVAVMQKHLERAIAAKAKKAWNPGKERGRIAPGSLYKVSAGDTRVFRQRFETKARSTSVTLLVDCSGSMRGSSIELAGTAAYALSSVLERLRVNHEVIGFTSYNNPEMTKHMRADAESHGSEIYGMGWARVEPIYMPVFKPFSGKLDAQARSRIAHLCEGPRYLAQNIDGESVQIAGHRLMRQNTDRHIMIVLSDGEPACSSGRGLGPHLRKSIQELTKAGVEVIGIGIESTAVRKFYDKNVVINKESELPTTVMTELTKILLAG